MNEPTYIARKDCGCIVLAVVDHPAHKHNTATEIARALREGLTVERVDAEYVRQNMKRCEHGKV